jgi:hypothetical protein
VCRVLSGNVTHEHNTSKFSFHKKKEAAATQLPPTRAGGPVADAVCGAAWPGPARLVAASGEDDLTPTCCRREGVTGNYSNPTPSQGQIVRVDGSKACCRALPAACEIMWEQNLDWEPRRELYDVCQNECD